MTNVGLELFLKGDASNAEQAMDKFYQSVLSMAKNIQTAVSNIGGSGLSDMFKPLSDSAKNATKSVIDESRVRIQAGKEETTATINDSKVRVQSLLEEAAVIKNIATESTTAAQEKINASKASVAATNEKIAASRAEQAASQAEAAALRLSQAQSRDAAAAKRAEKDVYSTLIASVQAITREYYNAAAAAHINGDASEETAQKLKLMATAALEGNEQLKTIEAGAGRFQRNVGNYSGATTYLRQSIAQLSGEIPNFFQSMRIGFMSIGNNIQPISQAIAGLRAENAQLLAQGKQTVPILSTVVKSFLGWQTVLLVGVGLISAYGGKMVELVSDLYSGATASDKLAKAQKESGDSLLSTDQITKDYIQTLKGVDQARKNAIEKGAGEIAQVQQLTATMTNANVEIGVRKNAYDKLIALYPQLNGYATEESALIGGLAKTIDTQLIPALLKRAAVEGIQGAIVAVYKAQADAMINQVTLTNKVVDAQKEAAKASKTLADTHLLQHGGLEKVMTAWFGVYGAQQKVNKASEANLTNSAALVDTQKKLPELAKLLASATEDLSKSFLGAVGPSTALEDKLKRLNAVLKTQTEGTASYKETKKQIHTVSEQLKAYSDSAINAKVHTDALTKSGNTLAEKFKETAGLLQGGFLTQLQAAQKNADALKDHLKDLWGKGGAQSDIEATTEALKKLLFTMSGYKPINLNTAKGGGNPEKNFHDTLTNTEAYRKSNQNKAAGLFDELGMNDGKARKDIKRREDGQKDLNKEYDRTYSKLNKIVSGPLDDFTHAIFQGDNAMEALGNSIKNVVEGLVAAVIKAGALSLIMSAINPLGFAGGGGFGGILGKLLPFATGGIVTGPTPALIGEAGPEAVIPLNKLGSVIGSQNVNVTVTGKTRGKDLVYTGDNYNTWKKR